MGGEWTHSILPAEFSKVYLYKVQLTQAGILQGSGKLPFLISMFLHSKNPCERFSHTQSLHGYSFSYSRYGKTGTELTEENYTHTKYFKENGY